MANHASALKANRQNEKRKIANRSNRSRLRSGLKKFESLLEEKKSEQARAALPDLYALVDKAVRKKALSKNAGDRQKSRLTKSLNRLGSGAATS